MSSDDPLAMMGPNQNDIDWQERWNAEVTKKVGVIRRLLMLRSALETIAHDPSIGNPWAKQVARDALGVDDQASFRAADTDYERED